MDKKAIFLRHFGQTYKMQMLNSFFYGMASGIIIFSVILKMTGV
jgi:hypothetical protein